jgi:hypothetical protein
VSWQDYRDGPAEIYFARISAGGSKIGSDLQITDAAWDSLYPALAWTGSEFGVSWHDARDGNLEIYFARISAGGSKLGNDVRITFNAGDSAYPSLAWTGSEFGVSWHDYSDGNDEIYFARISAGGSKIGSDLRITFAAGYSVFSSLAWTGNAFGVSWSDTRDGGNQIYFARISASGTKIGADVRITNADGDGQFPSMVWTVSEYGVSWQDQRDGNLEIYFARIGCQ